MNIPSTLKPSRLLVGCALVLGAAAARAAAGYLMAPEQEALVKPGMHPAQVEQAIGRPAQNLQFANEPGPTWTYAISGDQMTLFDVVFGADGRVARAGERLDGAGRAHGDRR